jgi:hypothetical protein
VVRDVKYILENGKEITHYTLPEEGEEPGDDFEIEANFSLGRTARVDARSRRRPRRLPVLPLQM